MAPNADSVRLRAHWSMGVYDAVVWFAVLGGVGLLLGSAGLPGLGIGGMLAVVAAAWSWRFRRRVGIVLTPAGATAYRLVTQRSVQWSDVAALRITGPQASSSRPWGYVLVPVCRMGRSSGFPHGVYLELGAASTVRSFMALHVPHVAVDPKEPWRDRFGRWHGPLHEFDPEESIRTIRRAAVGPFVVRIEAAPSSFIAVAEDPDGRRVLESPPVGALGDAVTEALGQIEVLRAQL